MEKRRILLPSKRFFKADEEDLDIRFNLDETENLLREGDMNIILDIEELFDRERNNSKNYKIHGKIRMVFRNLYEGDTSHSPLLKYLYLNENNNRGALPYNEFAFLRNDVVRESITPSSGSSLSTYNPTFSLLGGEYTGHTTITPITAPYHNWNIFLSYVYSGDTGHSINYTLSGDTNYKFYSGDGIPFRVTTGTTSHMLTSPVEHGFSGGEHIIISGRTIYVNSVGNETYNSKKYVLNIKRSDIPSGFTIGNFVLGKRCLDINNVSGSTSQYYVHKHKLLTSSSDYILDKIGFETSIWEDEKKILLENRLGENDVIVEKNRMESLIYDFKEPFVLTGITNNLGYTPTEVYVTVLLRNGNGYFNYPPKVGWKFNFHDTWIDNQFSGITTGNTDSSMGTGTPLISNNGVSGFTQGNILPINTSGLTGAFVEYNVQELKERVISDALHKITNPTNIFNHNQDNSDLIGPQFSGATANNLTGLYYQPFNRVKLRELSPYIEESKTDDILNLPENTRYFSKEQLWKWRDLYDHGFIDSEGHGTRFPFINNIHYVKKDINFYLRNETFYKNKVDGLNDPNNQSIDC